MGCCCNKYVENGEVPLEMNGGQSWKLSEMLDRKSLDGFEQTLSRNMEAEYASPGR